MITGVHKDEILEAVRDILKAEPLVTALVPKRNIFAGTSEFNNLQAAIDILDGGDEIQSEIRRRVAVQIVIKTRYANVNKSDMMCTKIESAVLNSLLTNQTLDGYASRFIEGSSEPVPAETEDPNVRMRIITMKFEYM